MVVQDVLAEVGDALEKVEGRLRAVLAEGRPATREITRHLADGGGKRVRPILALLAARVFGANLDHALPVAVAAELIHMATLIHDDVIDQAATRRGRPTANSRWGNHTSVLAGDCLLAKALVVLVEGGTPETIRVMADMIFQMCQGEIEQNATLGDVNQSEQDYFDRIEKKTALFFGACCYCGGLMNGADPRQAEALYDYGRDMGMAFQIVDDVLDVAGDAAVVGKPVGHDVASGILTLPVLYLLQREPWRGRLLPLLEKGGRSGLGQGELAEILGLLRQNGALDYSYGVARQYARRARGHLQVLPAGRGRDLLERVTSYLLERPA